MSSDENESKFKGNQRKTIEYIIRHHHLLIVEYDMYPPVFSGILNS